MDAILINLCYSEISKQVTTSIIFGRPRKRTANVGAACPVKGVGSEFLNAIAALLIMISIFGCVVAIHYEHVITNSMFVNVETVKL